jgi:hypothetical protein
MVTQILDAKPGHVPKPFGALVSAVGSHLTRHVYQLLSTLQKSNEENVDDGMSQGARAILEASCGSRRVRHYARCCAAGGKPGRGSKGAKSKKPSVAKVMRESRLIPTLVFHVEQFEVMLLRLSKMTKVR